MTNLNKNVEELTNHISNVVEKMNVKNDYYPVFIAENFLTNDIYDTLSKTFPENNFNFTTTDGYHNRGTQNFDNETLFNINPAWEIFYKSITSDKFIEKLGQKLAPHIYKDRGRRVFKKWTVDDRKNDINNLILSADFKVDSIGRRGKINPHKDASRKLVTIMFYFADEDWREEWGGDTLFYSFKSKKCEKIWKKKKWYFKNNVPIESLDEFYELFEENLKGYFKPNSIGGMCANEYSYHAVNPINIDESRKRKSVRLCLELNKPYPLSIQLTNKIKNYINKIT